MLDAHHPGQDQRPGGQQPGDRRRNRPGGEQHHHHRDDDERAFGAGAERDRLTADDPRFVDDEHVGILEIDGEGVPRALQQHHVAGGEADLLGAEILPLRWTASTTRSPLSVTIPGNAGSRSAPSAGGR